VTVAFKQLRVYVRGAVILVAALAIVLVLVKNSGHTVRFWFFGFTDDTKPVNVVWLLLCTAIAALVVRWVFSLGWGLLRDVREVKRQRAIDQVTGTLQQRGAELDDQERRIDEKLRRAIADEEEVGD
jgi:uncharacterized membrane-anchored protein